MQVPNTQQNNKSVDIESNSSSVMDPSKGKNIQTENQYDDISSVLNKSKEYKLLKKENLFLNDEKQNSEYILLPKESLIIKDEKHNQSVTDQPSNKENNPNKENAQSITDQPSNNDNNSNKENAQSISDQNLVKDK